LDAVENGARNRLIVARNAAVRDLIFPACNSAWEYDFPLPIKRLEAKAEPETSGGLDGLVECGVVHVDVLIEIERRMCRALILVNDERVYEGFISKLTGDELR